MARMIPIEQWLKETSRRVDAAMDGLMPPESADPSVLHQAMRYSLFAGGKRLRPALCMEAHRWVSGRRNAAAMRAACALEMMHTYSLIHDDLPCMDDDDLRRGRPTCHKVFGEGIAVLAGDALFAKAFEIFAATGDPDIIRDVAVSIGSEGMVGGQVADLLAEGQPVTGPEVESIHRRKTGALLNASLRVGARLGGCTSAQLAAITRYGAAVGLAFQVVDDLLDVIGARETLGKAVGADGEADKATYPKVYGVDGSRAIAHRLAEDAHRALKAHPDRAEHLHALADFIIERMK